VGGVPASENVAAAMYRQERDDRLYVERLFVLREEHHARTHLTSSETHARECISAMCGFESQLQRLAAEHSAEQAALQFRLEDSTHVARMRRQLKDGIERVEAERAAIAELQREIAGAERARREAVEAERAEWAEEKVTLLRRIDALAETVQRLRSTGTAPLDVWRTPSPEHSGTADAVVPTTYRAPEDPPKGRSSSVPSERRAEHEVVRETTPRGVQDRRFAGEISGASRPPVPRANLDTTDVDKSLSATSPPLKISHADGLMPAHTAMERTRMLLARVARVLHQEQESSLHN